VCVIILTDIKKKICTHFTLKLCKTSILKFAFDLDKFNVISYLSEIVPSDKKYLTGPG
jgi:hypothetical protein